MAGTTHEGCEGNPIGGKRGTVRGRGPHRHWLGQERPVPVATPRSDLYPPWVGPESTQACDQENNPT